MVRAWHFPSHRHAPLRAARILVAASVVVSGTSSCSPEPDFSIYDWCGDLELSEPCEGSGCLSVYCWSDPGVHRGDYFQLTDPAGPCPRVVATSYRRVFEVMEQVFVVGESDRCRFRGRPPYVRLRFARFGPYPPDHSGQDRWSELGDGPGVGLAASDVCAGYDTLDSLDWPHFAVGTTCALR